MAFSEIKIVYSPASCWGVDVRDVELLLSAAESRVLGATADSGDGLVWVSSFHEAEAAGIAAMRLGVGAEFCFLEGWLPKAVGRGPFFAALEAPLRELCALRAETGAGVR